MTNDRTYIILALAADAVRLVAINAPGHRNLSDGLHHALDHSAVANLWPPTEADRDAANWLARFLTGAAERSSRNIEGAGLVAIGRHLAVVAASLTVRGGLYYLEAWALWTAASKLLGLEVEPLAEREAEAATQCLEAVLDNLERAGTPRQAPEVRRACYENALAGVQNALWHLNPSSDAP